MTDFGFASVWLRGECMAFGQSKMHSWPKPYNKYNHGLPASLKWALHSKKGLWEDVAEHIGNLNRVKIIKESNKTFKSVIHVLTETSVIFSLLVYKAI